MVGGNSVTVKIFVEGGGDFNILLRIDPAKVRKASPWAKRFLDIIPTFMK
jgi:hypothetical protein